MLKILSLIILLIIILLIVTFIFCSCILAKKADDYKEYLLHKK